LPATAERAGKVLSFDSGGNVTVTTSTGGGGGASDASAVAYTPGGAGAVETTVQAKLRQIVSVKDFWCLQGDGTTDDTAFISAALNSGATTVYFPSGTYKITACIFCTVSNNLTVIGDGAKIDMDSVEITEMLKFNIHCCN